MNIWEMVLLMFPGSNLWLLLACMGASGAGVTLAARISRKYYLIGLLSTIYIVYLWILGVNNLVMGSGMDLSVGEIALLRMLPFVLGLGLLAGMFIFVELD